MLFVNVQMRLKKSIKIGDDNEQQLGKDAKGSKHALISGTILEFLWGTEESHRKCLSG
jgi:hypothetical protein